VHCLSIELYSADSVPTGFNSFNSNSYRFYMIFERFLAARRQSLWESNCHLAEVGRMNLD